MINNDPFEEFEFKPLTEGLGFHRKSTETRLPKTQQKTSESQTHANPVVYTPPLQRTSATTSQPHVNTTGTTTSSVDDILKSLGSRRRYDIQESQLKKELNEPTAIKYSKSSWDLSACLLDAMLVIASYLACMIVLLLVTGVDLFANIYNPDAQGSIYLSMALLFVGLSFIYLVVNRIFLGFTPGEWVFDQRIGPLEELGTASYSLKIFLRTVVVIASGFILVPFLSLIFQRDIVGNWLGAELLKKA